MQSFADDLAFSEANFIDTVGLALISSIAEIVDQENTNARQSEKCFPHAVVCVRIP